MTTPERIVQALERGPTQSSKHHHRCARSTGRIEGVKHRLENRVSKTRSTLRGRRRAWGIAVVRPSHSHALGNRRAPVRNTRCRCKPLAVESPLTRNFFGAQSSVRTYHQSQEHGQRCPRQPKDWSRSADMSRVITNLRRQTHRSISFALLASTSSDTMWRL